MLAFDHRQILADGVDRARAKLEYTPLAGGLLRRDLHHRRAAAYLRGGVGRELDPRNFHRKVTSTGGFVQPMGESTTRDGGRPAQLYRVGDAECSIRR